MKTPSCTFCPFPWTQLGVTMDESVRVCCYSDVRSFEDNGKRLDLSDLDSMDDYLNHDLLKSIRSEMIAGKKPDYCKGCYREEEQGQTSPRQIFNDFYKSSFDYDKLVSDTAEDGTFSGDVRILDLFAGNKCNLKCRMCSPFFSSIMADDFKKAKISFNQKEFDKVEKSWKADQKRDSLFNSSLKAIDTIKVAGGEPFITEEHIKLLENAVSLGYSKNIKLSYNTNLTVLPERLLKLWREFHSIDLNISLDASDELYEYIRQLGRWGTIKKNLNILKELKKEIDITLSVVTVLQAYNVFKLTDLLEFLLDIGEDVVPIPHYINLEMPYYLSTNILTAAERKRAFEHVKDFFKQNSNRYKSFPHQDKIMINQNNLLAHLEHLQNQKEDEKLYFEFLLYTKKLDKLYKKNLFDFVPELKRT